MFKNVRVGLRGRLREMKTQDIVMCRVVRVTKVTGSSSDDWIY
jgi:hypothetical protein